MLTNNRLSRRGVLRVFGLASGGLVASGLLAACGSPAPQAAPAATTAPAAVVAPAATAAKPASGKTPKPRGILKIALNQEANTVDPHKSRDIAGTQIKSMIYSQLIKYGRDLKIQPDLAERYENTDPTTYVFTLRKG